MLDWVVVGAGLHGVYLARLLLRSGLAQRQLRVIDPHTEPMAVWRRRTAATGMRYLRSPAAHHLGDAARELIHYANQTPGRAPLAGYYRRPSLSLFNAHSRHLIERCGLGRCLTRDRVHNIQRTAGGYRVLTDNGEWRARHVLLALGQPEPHRPGWAQPVASIPHIFDTDFDLPRPAPNAHASIIGGGLSAVQLALSWVAAGGVATLLSRHQLRVAAFDADPCYLGPLCLRGFHAEPDPVQRRQMLLAARQPGTVPPTTLHQMHAATDTGRFEHIRGQVSAVQNHRLILADGRQRASGQIILATGFSARPPGGSWVAAMAQTLRLPCAPGGYPLINKSLEWAPGLFVCGRLAELELGPAAGNIAGARMTGRRLLEYCRQAD